jgi:beta-glucuronidase
VYLRGGTYNLSAPVAFTSQDSGSSQFPITYQGYANEIPIISGGKVITGWTTTTVNGKTAWQTTIPASIPISRQLFVNAVRAVRAKTDNNTIYSGWNVTPWTNGTQGGYNTPQTLAVANPTDIEVVSQDNFMEYRCAIAKKTATQVILQQTCWNQANSHAPAMPIGKIANTPSWLENAQEFLDKPGEFYANPRTNVIQYIPTANQNINTPIVMPYLENLISLNNVSNLTFKNLKFVYNTWTVNNTNGITLMIPDAEPAILMTGGSSVSFDSLIFQHLGGSGITITSAKNTSVTNSSFGDISGRGITVSDSGVGGANPNIIIRNNTISKAGAEFHGDDAMVLGHNENILVDHNTLTDLPYSGIHIACSGGICTNFVISANLIKNPMQLLVDGGGIYSGGSPARGLVIEKNYITGQSHFGGAIYLDSGSMYKIVRNNVLFGNTTSLLLSKGGSNTISDNYWQNDILKIDPGGPCNDIGGASITCPPNTISNNHIINALSGTPQAIVNDAGAHATAITPAITPTPTPATRIPGDYIDDNDLPSDQVNMWDYNFIVTALHNNYGNPYTIFDYSNVITNFGL